MVNLTRRTFLQVGATVLLAHRFARRLGELAHRGVTALLGEPSTTHSYEEGVEAAPVPLGEGVVAEKGTPAYSSVDAAHGELGWVSSAAVRGGCLVYDNPATAASSGSVYVTPHTIAPRSTASVVALWNDINGAFPLTQVRLKADGRVEVVDGAGFSVTRSNPIWISEQRLRLDWQQSWDGANLSLTVWVYAHGDGEVWRSDAVLHATFSCAEPRYVALGQADNRKGSVGFDTYREYPFAAIPAPFAPMVGAVSVHSYDEGVDTQPVVAGENTVLSVSGTPTYAAAAALHGPMGVLLPLSTAGVMRYDNPYPPAHSGSLYVRTLARKGSSRIVTIQNGSTVQAQIQLSSRGAVCIVSPGGVVLAKTTVSQRLNRWSRIDWQSTWDGTSLLLTVRYYWADPESSDSYMEVSATLPATATPDRLAIGSTARNWTIHLDTVRTYGDASTWPGPVNPSASGRAPGMTTWAGDATSTSVEVSAYTNGTTAVGLLVSSNADMSAATSWPSGPPNGSGWIKWSVTGLTPGSQYYHQLTDTPVAGEPVPIGAVSTFKTLQPAGVPCITRIAVGSCGQTTPTTTAAFDDIVAWKPDRTVHLGDFGYPNDLSPNPVTHMNNWSLNCTDVGISRIQAIGCMDYVISDHDDNGTGSTNIPTYNDPITTANLSAWQQVVPARMEDTQSPPHGRWRSEIEGNVRYVKLDTRSIDKTDNTTTSTDPRSPDSTMLGANQLAWLLGQIDAAGAARQLVILFTDPAWNGTSPGPPIPVTYGDKWPSYIYERNLISDYAASHGAELFIVFGDSHGLQQDDGTNEKNGFASICCGPFDQNLHMHYQDSYQWSYPAGISDAGGPYRNAQQYRRLTIAQEPGSSTIEVKAEARDCSPAVTGTPLTVRTMIKSYTL